MKARPSVLKRQKERARLEKRQHKEERRAQRKADSQSDDADGGDPDIDWIVPGPQPREEEEYDWSKIAPQLLDPKTRRT